jgi:hypothetical protein
MMQSTRIPVWAIARHLMREREKMLQRSKDDVRGRCIVIAARGTGSTLEDIEKESLGIPGEHMKDFRLASKDR